MRAWVELWVRLKVVDLVAQTAWMTLTEKLEFEKDLCGLVHYSYWGMDADGTDIVLILDEVDRVIRMDSAFTNQNKHLYKLLIGEATLGRGGGKGAGRGDNGTVWASQSILSGEASAACTSLRVAGTEREAMGGVLSRGDLLLEKDFPLQGRASRWKGETFAFDCLVRERKRGRETAYMNRLQARLDGVAVSGLKAGEVWRIIIRAGDRDEAFEKVEKMVVTRSRREGLLLNPHYQRFEIISSTRLEGEGG